MEVEGKTEKLNDEFIVRAGTSWKSFKITEVIPTKKIVWFVSDSNLPWNTDLKEWKGTEIVWEISNEKKLTEINFTHIGLSKLDFRNHCMNSWGWLHQTKFVQINY